MAFIIGFLTLVMVVDCIIVILLVLIQLPKKEAGAGLAFGAGATDALFGAGSGTVLTKITKYASGVFFVLALVLSILQSSYHRHRATAFESEIGRAGETMPALPPETPASKGVSSTAAGAVVTTSNTASTPLESTSTGAPAVTIPQPAATVSNAAPGSAPK